MKRHLLTLLLGALLTQAAQFETIPLINDNHFDYQQPNTRGVWYPNTGLMKQTPGAHIGKHSHGRFGSCMKITNTDTGYGAAYSNALFPIQPDQDQLLLTIQTKGTGTLHVCLYLYDHNRRYLGNTTLDSCQINHSEWTQHTIHLNLKDRQMPPKALFSRLVFVVTKRAEIYLDDLDANLLRPIPDQR